MGIALMLIPLIPVFIESAQKLIGIIRSHPDLPAATAAQLDAASARLDETVALVKSLEIRDV